MKYAQSVLLLGLLQPIACYDGSHLSAHSDSDSTHHTDGDGDADGDGDSDGDGSDTDDGNAEPPAPNEDSQASVVRRLTAREYENTVRDLLGPVTGLRAMLPADSRDLRFSRIAQAQTVSAVHVESYFAAATAVAEAVMADPDRLSSLLPCDPEIFGPTQRQTRDGYPGDSLVCVPNWLSSNTDEGEKRIFYSDPDKHLLLPYDFPTPGRYRIELEARVELTNGGSLSTLMPVRIGEQIVGELDVNSEAYAVYSTTWDASEAGTQIVEFAIPENLYDAQKYVYVRTASIDGPIDEEAEARYDERIACGHAFVAQFAPRAWRRPLTDDERERLESVFTTGMDTGYFFDGVRTVIESVLQSPYFLYQVEFGEPVEGRPGYFRLDDHELASRLSYTIWQTMPDAQLLAAAEAGALRTTGQVAEQAARLFSDPRAHDTVLQFYAEWLGLDALDTLTRDLGRFPGFTEPVREAMEQETRIFLETMTWDEEASLADMLSATHSWVNEDLAAVYGLEISGSQFQRVELPPERAGLLTHPSVLTVTSKPQETSPVHRGLFVLEQFLCVDLPSPPDDVDIEVPPLDPDATTRERYSQHSSDPACSGCHSLIDPIGFAFEDFDAIGAHRLEENGKAIDAAGGVPSANIPNGDLFGGAEVSAALADTESTQRCLARKWLRFGLGRVDLEQDEASISQLYAALSEGSVRQMMIELVATEAFAHRVVFNDEEGN